MEDTDVQLHLKKRARRRLVGAVAFVALVAVALPMIMDQEPKQAVQDVEIRIPGQDEKPFAPKFAAAPVETPAAPPKEPTAPAAPEKTPDPAPKVEPTAKLVEKPVEKAVEKPAEKAPEKSPAKIEKPIEKPAEKPVARNSEEDSKRAAAILAGKASEPAAKGGDHVVLIGAFANEANVKTIKGKLGELGIKTYTEPLDSPQGRKTRVRAGPFPNREAAEKALDRMKRIGVSGVVSAK
jgi:DedD protein